SRRARTSARTRRRSPSSSSWASPAPARWPPSSWASPSSRSPRSAAGPIPCAPWPTSSSTARAESLGAPFGAYASHRGRRGSQLLEARHPAFRAVEAEGADVAQVFADEAFSGAHRVPQRRGGPDEGRPDDLFGLGVVLPEADQAPAVEDGVV